MKKRIIKKKRAVKTAKKAVKKTAKKKPATVAKKIPVPKPIGVVTHFYNHISVAIVRFNKPVKKGTALGFKGATTDFKQSAVSMQYDHKAIAVAPKGKQVGIKVKKAVREGDEVFTVK